VSRDTSQPAPGWRAVTVGVWVREPHGGPSALVRAERGACAMRIGGGAWMPAGDTLLAATEHAGGHAVRLELMAARGGQDLVGPCAICARGSAKGEGR